MTPARPEEQFQQQVIDLAHIYGWRIAHFRPARTQQGWRTAVAADGAGFPDLVLVRGPDLIFAELKAERGVVSAAQREWLEALAVVAGRVQGAVIAAGMAAGGELSISPRVDVYLWRPAEFDEIHDRLRRPQPVSAAA